MNSRSRVDSCWRILLLAASSLLLLGSSTVLAQDAGTVTLAQIHAQWRNRQQRTRSFEFKWKDVHVVAPDYIRGIHVPGKAEAPDVPEETSTYTERQLLMMDGARVRYEYEGQQPPWMTRTTEWTHRKFISTVNDRDNKTLLSPQGHRKNYQGTIEADNKMVYWSSSVLGPLRYTYRMLDAVAGPHRVRESAIVARNVNLRGHKCVLLEGPAGVRKRVIYVDPQRDCIVLRYAYIDHQGNVHGQKDIEYERDPNHGWVPIRWQHVRPEGRTITSTVQSYRFNFRPDPANFELKFPVGTCVLDQKNNRSFIVRRGGDLRIILPQEMGLSYEQLAATETGHGFQPSLTGRLRRLWWLGAGLLVVLSGLLYWRHLRAPR